MTTHINQTPLEAHVRAYFAQHNLQPKEFSDFEKDKHVREELRPWVCLLELGSTVKYQRKIFVPGGSRDKNMDLVREYQAAGSYHEHVELTYGGRNIIVTAFPHTSEYQIITTVNKKSDLDVKTSLDDIAKLFPGKEQAA
jgi:hypothetical protein